LQFFGGKKKKAQKFLCAFGGNETISTIGKSSHFTTTFILENVGAA
jgi:hypothetical protein